jgi:aspartokinase
MTTISHLVREYIEQKPFLQEALRQGIINYAALAEQVKEYLDDKLGTEVKHISIIMAIRRYQEKLSAKEIKKIHYGEESEANLKTNLHMFTVTKSNSILEKLNNIFPLIDFKSGGILHIVQGNYQVGIITNSYNADKIREQLKDEEIIREDKNLVSIALKYSDEMIDAPGSLFILTRALAWENITIIDLIETMSESIFIVKEKDATRALNKLNQVMKEYK